MRITSVLQTIVATALAVATASVNATTNRPRVTLTFANPAAQTSVSSPIQDGRIVTAHIVLNDEFASNPPEEVEVSAPGLRFGRTTFRFDRNNRDSYRQVVTCRTDSGSAPTRDGAVVNVPVTLTYKQNGVVQQQRDTQVVQRQVVSSGRCSGWGDPHLTSMDGVAFDFQPQGVFQLFQSNNFQVQIFQEKCGPVSQLKDAAPSCYQGVAVSFGASVAKFFIQNGKISVAKGSPGLQWLSVEKLASTSTDGYRVFTNVDHGTYVDINLDRWAAYGNYPYLNVALQVSPYFKNSQVQGIMGNWNGNRADDITDNKRLAGLYGVSLTDNLFTCINDGCTKHVRPSTIEDSNAAALPTEQSLLHQGYRVVAADSITLGAFSPKLRDLKLRRLEDYTAGVVAAGDAASATNATTVTEPPRMDVSVRATQLCNQVITGIPACSKYVRDTKAFIDRVCVADAVMLSDLSVVDNSKLAYLRECRRELDARIEAEVAGRAETAQLISDRASLMFGDMGHCINDCSGRGECLAAGCSCRDGFTGLGCATAI